MFLIMMPPVTILIGLGSNCHPRHHFAVAMASLRHLFPDIRFSPPRQTPPLDGTGPDYLNAVACATTTLPAPAVAVALKAIERQCGRAPHKDAIPLDLDFLDYGRQLLPDLRLPRLDLLQLPFYAVPARLFLEPSTNT